MSISLEKAAEKYLAAKTLSSGTCKEYRSTVTKWITWAKGVDVDQIGELTFEIFLTGSMRKQRATAVPTPDELRTKPERI